ncbi:MAG: bifunctional glutamate N-acetyltransferase/amino-acid acetyltransferase ArgJ [Thiohalomonadales bacterium]
MNNFPIAGIRLASIAAGIKKNNKDDLVAIEIAAGSFVAAVFTQNAFCAAPVVLSRENLQKRTPRCLLINSGNANAGTGQQGIDDARACCEWVAKDLGCGPEEVLPFSTGVIGENLPLEKFLSAIPTLLHKLQEEAWQPAAEGILTTDTRPKLRSRQIQIEAETITITGMAKGAGMIMPNMATLLAYIGTDANIEQTLLCQCLQYAVQSSFNKITVDGDTSTNDSCVLIATNQSNMHALSDVHDKNYILFRNAVSELCQDLAKDLIRDAEGATKLVNIVVSGGRTVEECRDTAYTIAHSPLTKTAMFACDPNWGRILAAVGRSGVEGLDANNITICLDDVLIACQGGRNPEYREVDAQKVMDKSEYTIAVNLGLGECEAHVWTCDLSYDYIKINAEYRS